MASVGSATIEVGVDTTQARKDLEELAEMSRELEVRAARTPFSLGDAGVVASVLGFVGYLVHAIWG
jgi:hypothetical protein